MKKLGIGAAMGLVLLTGLVAVAQETFREKCEGSGGVIGQDGGCRGASKLINWAAGSEVNPVKAHETAAEKAATVSGDAVAQDESVSESANGGSQEEAIEFVKNFPIRNTMISKCPTEVSQMLNEIGEDGDVMAVDKVVGWKKVKTIGDELECRPLFHAAVLFDMKAMMLKKAGEWPGREQFAAEILGNDPDADTERFNSLLSASWRAVQMKGKRYYVEAAIVERQPGDERDAAAPKETTEKWLADMGAKTLKPLNLSAWEVIDFRAAVAWIPKSKKAMNTADRSAVVTRNVAPAYGIHGRLKRNKRMGSR